jgi:hypothetical protein
MTRANSVPLRLSSEVCSTCNELHVLKARIEDAHRNAGEPLQRRNEGDRLYGFAESRRRIEADFRCAQFGVLRD